jgi:hypothetical protein
MPNALCHRAARRPVPRASLYATSGAAMPAAMSQGEQRGQLAEGHHDQEDHPFHPEQVRVLQAARQARCRQGPRDHRNPAQGQQRAEEAGHRNRQPGHPVTEPGVVPAMTRDHRGGGEPAAEHDGRGPGQQRRAPPAQVGAHRPAVQHDAGRSRDRDGRGDGDRPYVGRRVVHDILL